MEERGGIGSGSLKTPLDRRVYRVHHVMLRRLDPHLYFELEKHGVLPQLYMLRWLRLLFAREASLDQLLILWDTILGDPQGFELVDYTCLSLVCGLRDGLVDSSKESDSVGVGSSGVLRLLLKRYNIQSSNSLITAARALKQDKLICQPVAQMQVYNSPLQGNGSRMRVTNSGRPEVKRAPMEGYVVGVRSQTLYWCVLDGPRLMWYSDPARRETVAETWLDGCEIVALGKDVIEIQAPLSDQGIRATSSKITEEQQGISPQEAATNNTSHNCALDPGNGCTSVSTSTRISGSAVKEVTAEDDQNATQAAAPVEAHAVAEADTEGNHTTNAHTNTYDNNDDDDNDHDHDDDDLQKPVRMSVRFEVKDPVQYMEWLRRLRQASMSLRNQSTWRQCFA